VLVLAAAKSADMSFITSREAAQSYSLHTAWGLGISAS
jgi:hypothetical protein